MENWSSDREFLQTFRAEAEERLHALGKGLLLLEESPGDEELVKRLFREAHTLKGSAGMMGLDAIRQLAHRVEDILTSVQKGQLKVSTEVADILLQALDRIEELLPTGEPDSPAPDADVSELLEQLSRIGEQARAAGSAAAAADQESAGATQQSSESAPSAGRASDAADRASDSTGLASDYVNRAADAANCASDFTGRASDAIDLSADDACATGAANNAADAGVRSAGNAGDSADCADAADYRATRAEDSPNTAGSASAACEVEGDGAAAPDGAASGGNQLFGEPDRAGRTQAASAAAPRIQAVPDPPAGQAGEEQAAEGTSCGCRDADTTSAEPPALRAERRSGSQGRRASDGQPAGERAADSTIRVNIERLDKLLNLMGEILVNQVSAEYGVHELGGVQQKTLELEAMLSSLGALSQQLDGAGGGQIEAVSEKISQAREMLGGMSRGLGEAAARLKENTSSRRLALDELQERALNVRMLPLSTIFTLFPRVVRDAASVSSKKVKLQVSGEQTELDKRMLEEVSDPLMHILRNCVDHGIELPVERISRGKPEQGVIQLSASQRGDRVEIVVEDDGGGINYEMIRATALRRGIISAADALSEEECLDLLFRPGFTTAQSVTAISGRGVGLDVVRTNLEKLEGTVRVESTLGAGTRFVVSLPVTMAVMPGLVISCGDTRFVVPMAAVHELVGVPESEIQTLGNQRAFILRGGAVPLIDLTEFLGGEPVATTGGKVRAVVVGSEHARLGLQVERLVGEQEIVIKSLGSFLPRLPYIAGVTILGDGEAVLVLNVNALLQQARQSVRRAPARPQAEQPAAGSEAVEGKRVLIVEDSLVVRELQRNILQAAGYQVLTAVDGIDGLHRLGQEPVDCVLTDIEMPNMDGFSFTDAIREKQEIKDIPIVIMSSRSSDEDKQRGVEAGADAYFVKGSFDQQGLLDTIERLVA